jgi:hypothetical protein
MGEDGPLLVVEIELGEGLGQVKVGLKKAADGPDIPPIAVEQVAVDPVFPDGRGDQFPAKVLEIRPVEKLFEDLCVEEVDSH